MGTDAFQAFICLMSNLNLTLDLSSSLVSMTSIANYIVYLHRSISINESRHTNYIKSKKLFYATSTRLQHH